MPSTSTLKKIRIKSTPPGEAPNEIRRAWVGLEIPVPARFAGFRQSRGFGVLSGPKSRLGAFVAILFGRARQEFGYIVDAQVAIDLLSLRSPAAADWWRQNAPHLVEPGRYLIFALESCEELHEPTA